MAADENQQRRTNAGGGGHAKQAQFNGRLESGVLTVTRFEDATAQAAAMRVIPAERLRAEARALVAAAAAHPGAAGSAAVSHPDATLLRLLHWFKHEFFTWCNNPPCHSCGCTDTRSEGGAPPSDEDQAYGATRVEAYRCPVCAATTRFPRYNDAVKLLETRAGRCGEWANAFTLCCRAMGFEARWVMDWTDHVWTECWSETQGRWLHCDSCEDACDQPLLYEQGWGKKLSYVVAFGKDDVVDVTRRYVVDMADTATRRTECDELWLAGAVCRLTARLRLGEGGVRRRQALSARDAEEGLELGRAGGGNGGGGGQALPGRQTGSLAWRAARGELGPDPAATPAAAAPAATAPAPAPGASALEVQIPSVKPAPDDLVLAAATRVASCASAEQLQVIRRVLD